MPLTTYTAGEVLTAASLNANFSFAALNSSIAIFNETQASGTAGGTTVATTFTKRVLNTTVYNTITGCSIASSVITLPAGTFYIEASSPLYRPGRGRVILKNTTAGTNAILGNSQWSPTASDYPAILTTLSGTVVTTANTNFELQYYASTTYANDGLGVASSIASVSEVYASIYIEKIA
jgi:hypothetical protein